MCLYMDVLCVFVQMCKDVGVCVCAHVCITLWTPDIDSRYIPQLLCFTYRGKVFYLNPELNSFSSSWKYSLFS